MRKKKQLEFESLRKPKDSFGGSLLKGNAKTKRPLDSKLPILLTLRAVKGGMRLPKAFGKVDAAVNRCARKYGVRVYQYANVGNHIHLLIKIPRRGAWAGFIRELTGEIAAAMKVLFDIKEKFWMFRPHTRIVHGWRKAFTIAKSYVYLNIIEAEGFIDRREIRTLKDLRAIFSN
jgi:REP element-mobilizing transposase RayT